MVSPSNNDELSKLTNNKMKVEDFTIMKLVGKGSYGKVLLVKKNDDDQIYAMKVLKKHNMVKRNQVEHIKTERKIMELIDHPFIVKLKYAFQTPQCLYLVMDYCPGGELFFHIQRVERFNEEAVKFYAAQLVLAIEHLHQNNIIYRDLKPENVLIDQQGFIKVTDFGLSKENIIDNSSAKSFCGTPEYLAPEIIKNEGHGKAVDWWSLGSIIYEMLTGIPPFFCKDRDKLFESIKNGVVQYPEYLSEEVIDLMSKFLIKNPEQRLGSGANGVVDIKTHPFFKSIKWDELLKKKIKPPFIPRLKNITDIRYIDPVFSKQAVTETPNESMGDTDVNFDGFSYKNSNVKK